MHGGNPERVRELVTATLRQFDVPQEDLARLEETVLIQDGKYRARSYRAGEYLAMWLVPIGFVQVYDVDGEIVAMIEINEEEDRRRLAA